MFLFHTSYPYCHWLLHIFVCTQENNSFPYSLANTLHSIIFCMLIIRTYVKNSLPSSLPLNCIINIDLVQVSLFLSVYIVYIYIYVYFFTAIYVVFLQILDFWRGGLPRKTYLLSGTKPYSSKTAFSLHVSIFLVFIVKKTVLFLKKNTVHIICFSFRKSRVFKERILFLYVSTDFF